MNFSQLHLSSAILRALKDQQYEKPSPIQQKAIPPILQGRDLIGCAQTGTGKTCAFSTPIIQRLNQRRTMSGKTRPIRALVLTPTRELALQIFQSFRAYARYTRVRACVIFGGVSQQPQVEALSRGADVLIATPGRLNDLIAQGFISLAQIEIFVLDEADRMLDMGFIHDVRRVVEQIPSKRQTLLFSATMPREIEALADQILTNPVHVVVAPSATPVERIKQQVYFVDRHQKTRLLIHLLTGHSDESALVFTRTKHGADRVARDLTRAGISAMSIHGDKTQGARQQALRSFKEGRVPVLVATDIAARGIDVQELSFVFNYHLPEVPETYVHRIGRTGRAGKGGTAISFCDVNEKPLLKAIERTIHQTIPVVSEHPYPMTILSPDDQPKKQERGFASRSLTRKPSASRMQSTRSFKGFAPQRTSTGVSSKPKTTRPKYASVDEWIKNNPAFVAAPSKQDEILDFARRRPSTSVPVNDKRQG